VEDKHQKEKDSLWCGQGPTLTARTAEDKTRHHRDLFSVYKYQIRTLQLYRSLRLVCVCLCVFLCLWVLCLKLTYAMLCYA